MTAECPVCQQFFELDYPLDKESITVQCPHCQAKTIVYRPENLEADLARAKEQEPSLTAEDFDASSKTEAEVQNIKKQFAGPDQTEKEAKPSLKDRIRKTKKEAPEKTPAKSVTANKIQNDQPHLERESSIQTAPPETNPNVNAGSPPYLNVSTPYVGQSFVKGVPVSERLKVGGEKQQNLLIILSLILLAGFAIMCWSLYQGTIYLAKEKPPAIIDETDSTPPEGENPPENSD